MNANVRLLAILVSLSLLSAPLVATTRVGVFAIVDEVTLEPSDFGPDRILIAGVFVVPLPISSGRHQPPSRGYLYFGLNPEMPLATRQDWQVLKEAAGTGEVVGFGQYWVSHETESRGVSNHSLEVQIHTDRDLAVPESYPRPNNDGVVKSFDTQWDLCPRFGKPSSEIIAGLWEAHAPQLARPELPVCVERIGLIDSAELDSAFVIQTRHSDWADATETAILRRIVETPGLELSNLSVECRETICRIRFVFPTKEYQEATGNRLAARASNGIRGFASGVKVRLPRGTTITDYYIQRRRPLP